RYGDLPELVGALSKEDFLIDGEVVVFDEKNRTRFGLLQVALKEGGGGPLVFIPFDLLDRGGNSYADLPLIERKDALRQLLTGNAPRVQFSAHWRGSTAGTQLYRQACELGLEGIVSKRAEDPYLAGSRLGWKKVKCELREEFVICGYT